MTNHETSLPHQDVLFDPDDSASVDMPRRRTLPAPRRGVRHRLFIVVTMIAIFLFGLAAGGLVTGAVIVRFTRQLIAEPERWTEIVTNRLDRRLDLRPEQREAVEAIVATRMARLRALRIEVYPRVTAEVDAMKAEIEAELDPGQLAAFDQYYDELDRRIRPAPPQPTP